MHELVTSDIAGRGVVDMAGQPLPLTGVSIGATLAGPFLSAVMCQRWTNAGTKPVEALWHFPVPEGATVRGLVVERGGRRLVAEVRARDDAFDRFDRGMEDGKLSALLDAETEGLLAMRLGNMGPGESALVEVSWVSVIEEAGGVMRVRLPTAIAPRYFPAAGTDDDQVTKRERLDLPWVARVPYGISVDVDVLDGDGLAGVSSPSHTLDMDFAARPVRVRLGSGFSAVDRDFVLDLKTRADRLGLAWLEHGERGSWLAADLRMPEAAKHGARRVALLLDVSGSMQGTSLDAAKRAIKAGLASLGEADSFGLYAFNNSVWGMSTQPVPVSAPSLASARSWVDALEASGGTDMLPALESVYAAGGWTDVLVITDGDIGNEADVATLASTRLEAGTRTSLLGIGLGPAMDVLATVARSGGGATSTVHPGERIEARALSLFAGMLAARIEEPAFKAGGKTIETAVAIRTSAGARLRVLARLDKVAGVPEELVFTGHMGGQDIKLFMPIAPAKARASGAGGLAALWAKERVSDLLDRAKSRRKAGDRERLEHQAVKLSIEAGILSAVASMVAVDEDGPRPGADAVFMEIPVLMPAGWGGGDIVAEAVMAPTPGYPMSKSMISAGYVSEPMEMMCLSCASSTRAAPSRAKKLAAESSKRRKEADTETVLYELLALQLPGGGFGPEAAVLKLLDAGSLEELLHTLGLDKGGNPVESGRRLALLTSAVLAVFDGRYAAQAAVWEPLVGASRRLVTFSENSFPEESSVMTDA